MADRAKKKPTRRNGVPYTRAGKLTVTRPDPETGEAVVEVRRPYTHAEMKQVAGTSTVLDKGTWTPPPP